MSLSVNFEELGFVGSSIAMQKLYDKVFRVSRSNAPVFIQGETGTGKELCAVAVHKLSPRCEKEFVALNCGAIPAELMESEVFGHLKGSFTGAISTRDGAAKMADGGTLFLDEICEMPLELQTKLLRFLQTGMIQPVGAARPVKVDVRIVCATNKDPRMEVAEGRFREDLFYRLFVLPVKVPPLRLRGCDVSLIGDAFLRQFSDEEGKAFASFSDDALHLMEDYDWPGNVRELQNTIRQIVVMNEGDVVTRAMLVELLSEVDHGLRLDFSVFQQGQTTNISAVPVQLDGFKPRQLWQIERDAIEAAIVAHNGSIPKAAEDLGVSPSTIYRKRESWKPSSQAV